MRRRSENQSGTKSTPNFIIAIYMAHLITLIPGDGTGPEVADATVRAVDATRAAIEWERVEAGVRSRRTGPVIPDDVFASLEMTRRPSRSNRHPIGGGHRASTWRFARSSVSTRIFVRVRMLPGLKTRFQDLALDLAIFRETPRISIPDWNTRWCPAWWRA
jgi:isocitrate dehydrogenase (NAD+)